MPRFNKFSKGKPGNGPVRKNSNPSNNPRPVHRSSAPSRPPSEPNYEETGREAAYFKSLVDSETPLVVVLKSGEEVRGIVRYYDKEVFSLGPLDGSPKLFLRKESVRYLYEVE